MIDSRNIQAYNKVRKANARHLLCHAPFVNLNFEQNGNITACCYNRSYVLGKYPDNSLSDIWFGEKADKLREYIRSNDLSGGCSACEQLLNSGNYSGTKAIFYDEYADTIPLIGQVKRKLWGNNKPPYPKVLEFEISNTCNLECTMCNGYFSSSIRKNREHLPEVPNPFDDNFIEQIKKFIPHLTDAKFLGGEPFLIDLYYKIWDTISEINPNVKVHITTNGTILNGRVKDYLEKLNCGIIVSIESLNKTNYEKIRVNANYDSVMAHIHYFIELVKRKKTYLSFAVCPIKDNWMDLPEMVKFCNEHNIYLHFNTVWTPESVSLRFLNKKEFAEAISFLEKNDSFSLNTSKQISNTNNYRGVISQLKYWMKETEVHFTSEASNKNWGETFLKFSLDYLLHLPSLEMNILLAELVHYRENNTLNEEFSDTYSLFNSEKCLVSITQSLSQNLLLLSEKFSKTDFLKAYNHCLILFAKKTLLENELVVFNQKVNSLTEKFETIANKEELASELIRTGFIYLFNLVYFENTEAIIAMVESRFN